MSGDPNGMLTRHGVGTVRRLLPIGPDGWEYAEFSCGRLGCSSTPHWFARPLGSARYIELAVGIGIMAERRGEPIERFTSRFAP